MGLERARDMFRIVLKDSAARGSEHGSSQARAGGNGVSEEEIVEEHSRDPAGGVGKVELVLAMSRDDATAVNVRRLGNGDAEGVEDRQRVVGEELAAELVARKRVAVDERDGDAAPRQQGGERRAGRAGADDGDVYFHSSIPQRKGT